ELTPQVSTEDRPILAVSLRNTGSRRVVVDRAALPWGNRNSITLLAVPDGERFEQPIQLVFPIDDVIPGEIELAPKSEVKGQILLDHVFKDVGALLGRRPLFILWAYKLVANDGQESPYLSGVVSFPKGLRGIKK